MGQALFVLELLSPYAQALGQIGSTAPAHQTDFVIGWGAREVWK